MELSLTNDNLLLLNGSLLLLTGTQIPKSPLIAYFFNKVGSEILSCCRAREERGPAGGPGGWVWPKITVFDTPSKPKKTVFVTEFDGF